jgi:hypothetical protein
MRAKTSPSPPPPPNPPHHETGNYDWFDTYQKGYPFSYSKNQVLNWKATAPTGTTRKFVISVNGDQYYWKMPSIGVNAWVKNAVASLTKLMDTYGMDGGWFRGGGQGAKGEWHAGFGARAARRHV